MTTDMQTQLNAYLKGNATASPTALYTFFGGSNDIVQYFLSGRRDVGVLLATASAAAENIKSQITQLYNAGGRNFVWLNMYPMERTPAAVNVGYAGFVPPAVDQFNAVYHQAVQSLREQLPGIALTAVDFHALANDALDNPSKYNLTNVVSPAEGHPVNPDTYLFWDSLHPTTRGHQILADTVIGQVRVEHHATFFHGEIYLGNGVYYCAFPTHVEFGYYGYFADVDFVYHFDIGYLYVIESGDSQNGVYFYDFFSGHWWYTSPSLFSYLYDFTLNAWLYYYPNTVSAGHYTTNPRYFFNFSTNQIIAM